LSFKTALQGLDVMLDAIETDYQTMTQNYENFAEINEQWKKTLESSKST